MNKIIKKLNKGLGQYLFNNHDESAFDYDEYIKKISPLIGDIIYHFNFLNELLNSHICELIDNKNDELGATIICKMKFSEKRELLQRLLVVKSPNKEVQKYFLELIKNIKHCEELRNSVVHAEYGNKNGSGFTYSELRFSKKDKISQKYISININSLEESLEFIFDTIQDFYIHREDYANILNISVLYH